MNTERKIRGEVAVEVGTDMTATGIIGVRERVATVAGVAVQVLTRTETVGEPDMMMSGAVGAGPMGGIECRLSSVIVQLNVVFLFYLMSDRVYVCSASPVRRSPKSRRSPSPRRTPPRGDNPEIRDLNERSPASNDASPRGRRAGSRSPSPRRSDAEVSPCVHSMCHSENFPSLWIGYSSVNEEYSSPLNYLSWDLCCAGMMESSIQRDKSITLA